MNRYFHTIELLLRCCLGVVLTGLLCGCPKSDQAPVATTPASERIPLKVAMAGKPAEASAVQRAWLAVSDQPVELTAIDVSEGSDRLVELAQQSDVLIYPAKQTGQLQKQDAVRRLRRQFFSADSLSDDRTTTLLPALQQGILQYGDEPIGLPLGSVQAVLIQPARDAAAPNTWTWQTYAERVAELEEGQAAEPLADGWAAIALLNRANSYCRTAWLFSGDDLRPTLATAPYLRALRELQQDAAQYPRARMTPSEVWRGVCDGQLQLAISWPATLDDVNAEADLRIDALPTSDEVYVSKEQGWETRSDSGRDQWVFFMGDSPVASIAAGCRQTAASERFLHWLSGNEGTASLRKTIPMFTATQVGVSESGGSGNSSAGKYANVLNTRLAIRYVRPMLRIPGADQYMQALDREVIAVLEGNKTPEAALVDASVAWEQITETHDRRIQAKHWRMSQGMNR